MKILSLSEKKNIYIYYKKLSFGSISDHNIYDHFETITNRFNVTIFGWFVKKVNFPFFINFKVLRKDIVIVNLSPVNMSLPRPSDIHNVQMVFKWRFKTTSLTLAGKPLSSQPFVSTDYIEQRFCTQLNFQLLESGYNLFV